VSTALAGRAAAGRAAGCATLRGVPGRIDAVIFDIGGVVQDSPLHAIARYERDHGLPSGAINRTVAACGDGGAWARLERGELTVASFCAPFEADCRSHGLAVDSARLMTYIREAHVPRPVMLAAIRELRRHGLRVAALTNNWVDEGRRPTDGLREHFDVFVESVTAGVRKPDPQIYALVCKELGVPPARTAFLDDIGRNLKPARALGMATIKVDTPEQALAELGAVVGLDLLTVAAA
jgi:putative hydrolase of the HAD superfamily